MRAGRGKHKGGAFERLCCKELSLWMSEGKAEDYYWRSAMSGGRSTVAAAKGKRLAAQAGDISCVNELGHALTDQFLIECKTYRDLQFEGLIKGTGHLADFWLDTKLESNTYGKYPMLIAKQNQQPICVCINDYGRQTLGLDLEYHLYVPRLELYLILFDHFLKHAERPS
jgi:hypothetical protein